MTKVIIPVISEKAYGQSSSLNVFMFKVPGKMNKIEIKEAIEAQYEVDVTNVRTLVQNGKKARSIRLKQRGSYVVGKRSDVKKAYVTVKAGQTIPIFAGEQDDAQAPIKETK